MDELELLKSKWQEQEQELPTLSYKDIYKMILKKSSSIVKWIFVISIAEILFWIVLGLLTPETNKALIQDIGLQSILNFIYVAHYIIVAVFLVIFYLNWKNIQVTDTIKTLMHNILKTRKAVKYFVVYNVAGTVLVLIFVNLYFYANKEALYTLITQSNESYATIPQDNFFPVLFVSFLIAGTLLVGLILVFYRVIYGILLKRLKFNYKELEKMEM